MITETELLHIMPFAGKNAAIYTPLLSAAMDRFDINTPLRQSAFLAQVAHESGQLRYVRELASGEAYEGRADLGNTEPGDGCKFRGRGLIQITGRTNNRACGEALNLDLLSHPELLEQPGNACLSAAWFWYVHGLNELADACDMMKITRRINGGLNGYIERLSFYDKAKEALC